MKHYLFLLSNENTDYENLKESNNYMSFERLGTEIPQKVTLWAAAFTEMRDPDFLK